LMILNVNVRLFNAMMLLSPKQKDILALLSLILKSLQLPAKLVFLLQPFHFQKQVE
jgi:hypothetical protein